MEVPPVQGNTLVLTIDNSIQYIADRELAAGAEKAKARAGTAIVMESDTGRILAMSNYPRFDSNRYNEYKSEYWYNRAVTDVFEPGSTFKVAVAAAALKEGLARPNEMIDCQNGAITIGGHVFHDHNRYGLISLKKILAVSSNVGAAKLGLRLGQERLYDYIRAFGFGTPTGIDLPREENGIVRHWSKWSGLSIGAISFGHEVGVTSMQILTAVNAIASGGFRVRPFIVDRIIDSEGNLVKKTAPEKTRILDEKTALPASEWHTSTFDGKVKKTIGEKNKDYLITHYHVNAMPYFVTLDSDGNMLGNPVGYVGTGKFLEFLEQ
jgi:cell division protein FtsI (penicillin-binding protein 3)